MQSFKYNINETNNHNQIIVRIKMKNSLNREIEIRIKIIFKSLTQFKNRICKILSQITNQGNNWYFVLIQGSMRVQILNNAKDKT